VTSAVLGPPVVDDVDVPAVPGLPRCRHGEPAAVVPPPRPGRTAPIALALGVLAVLLAGAALLRPPGAAATGDGAAVPPPGLTGFAELYVATWLSSGGSPGVLDPFLTTTIDLDGMDPGHRYVTRAAAVEASPVRDEMWSVTVAADVLDLVDGSYLPAGIEHYQVPISVDGVRLVALSLPARVSAPEPARLPASPAATERAVPDALLTTADQFLTALLTGAGDPSRFATPEAGITSIRPAPYTDVAVVTVTGHPEDADTVLQVTVRATAAGGHVHVMQYALRAGERSGVWEILALGPVPAAGVS
jgi:hypothetical protein